MTTTSKKRQGRSPDIITKCQVFYLPTAGATRLYCSTIVPVSAPLLHLDVQATPPFDTRKWIRKIYSRAHFRIHFQSSVIKKWNRSLQRLIKNIGSNTHARRIGTGNQWLQFCNEFYRKVNLGKNAEVGGIILAAEV